MSNDRPIVIIGDGETAQIAYEYFSYSSERTIASFSVEKEYMENKTLYNLPIVKFEEIEHTYPPDQFDAFVGISYTQLNRIRTRLYHETKAKGYRLASYISPDAFVWRNAKIGDNCFIFENNVIQHNVEIGNNVILWSGNHIGHQTQIEDNCYVASHVVISGFCKIGNSTFLGVNSCLNDKITVAQDCIIGSGAVVTKDTETAKVYVGNPARSLNSSSYKAFSVSEENI